MFKLIAGIIILCLGFVSVNEGDFQFAQIAYVSGIALLAAGFDTIIVHLIFPKFKRK